MSFSEQIKEEILLASNIKKCCKVSIRYGELFTEAIDLKKNEIKEITKDKLCCKKAFLKGVFLGSGYIIDPETEYHFEVSLNSKIQANYIIELLKEFDINAKVIKRNKYVVYVKDSESISVILGILGANNSLMQYENIRIEKSIKNDINRNINCETANIKKTVTTAVKQIQAIDKIISLGELNNLKPSLKEVCLLRKKYPEQSLEELAKLTNESLSKSGLYHRLNKIIKIAEKL